MNQIQLAVVVLLIEPERQHCIVPENYIYGLDELQDQLKTYGVNNKRNHLIFWKRSFLDDNIVPDSQEIPNFQLTPRNDFPPPAGIDSACYLARVKRFYSKYSILCCCVHTMNFFKTNRQFNIRNIIAQNQSYSI